MRSLRRLLSRPGGCRVPLLLQVQEKTTRLPLAAYVQVCSQQLPEIPLLLSPLRTCRRRTFWNIDLVVNWFIVREY